MSRKIPSLLLALLASILPASAAEKTPLFDRKPGVVSYTFRDDLKKDTAGTLDKIKAMGLTDIEFSDLFGHTAPALRKLLDDRGMTCSSYGTGYEKRLTTPPKSPPMPRPSVRNSSGSPGFPTKVLSLSNSPKRSLTISTRSARS